MGKKRTIFIVLLVAVAAFFFILPPLLTSSWALRYKLAQFDDQLPGQIHVGSCSLGWISGLSCSEISYRDELVQIKIPELSGDRGLWALLFSSSYQGTLTLEQPVCTLRSSVLLGGQAGGKTLASPAPASSPIQGTPWWERLSFSIRLQQGQLALASDTAPSQTLADDLEMDGVLALGTLKYTGTFRSPLEPRGRFQTEGFINLPTATQSLRDSLISQSKIDIQGLSVTPYLKLLAARGISPKGQGLLDASLQIATSGFGDIEFDGSAEFRNLVLSHPLFGGDQPNFNQMGLKWKGRYQGEMGWQLSRFSLTSVPLHLEAQGDYSADSAKLKADGRLDLPILSIYLPQLLGPHWQSGIKNGSLSFSLEGERQGTDTSLELDCLSEDLVLAGDTELFSENNPFALQTTIKHTQGHITVPALQLDSPLLTLHGKGSLDAFLFQGAADLGQISNEFSPFFPGALRTQGQVELSGFVKANPQRDYQLEARLAIEDFGLFQGNVPILAPHHAVLQAGGRIPAYRQKDEALFNDLRFEGEFLPGSFTLTADEIEQKANALRIPYTLQADFDLAQINQLLWGLAAKNSPYALAGKFSGHGLGEWTRERCLFNSLEGTIDSLRFGLGALSWQEPRVNLLLTDRKTSREAQVIVRDLLVNENLDQFLKAQNLAEQPMAIRNLSVGSNWREFIAQSVAQKTKELGAPVTVQNLLVSNAWRHFLSPQRAALILTPKRLELRAFSLESANTSIQGSLSMGRSPRQDMQLEIDAISDARLLGNLLQTAGWLTSDLNLAGRAQSQLQLRVDQQGALQSDADIRLESFQLRQDDQQLFADQNVALALTLQAPADPEARVKISSLRLQSTPLRVEATGLVQRGDRTSIELQGSFSPDLRFFSELLPTSNMGTIRLNGKRSAPFLLTCPLRQPARLDDLTLSTQLNPESIQYRGLTFGQSGMHLDLNRNRLQLSLNAPFSSGRVEGKPQWRLDAGKALLTVPAAGQILRDVQVNPMLLEEIFTPMHPLFGIIAHPEGVLSLRLKELTWPMNAAAPNFEATISTGSLKWQQDALLQGILLLAGLPTDSLKLEEKALTCTGTSQQISCSPLHLLVGNQTLMVTGNSDNNGSLAYQIEVPITEQIAQKLKLPFTPGLTAAATLGGTLDAPVIDQKKFLYEVTGQLSEAERERKRAAETMTPKLENLKPSELLLTLIKHLQALEKLRKNSGKQSIVNPATRSAHKPAPAAPQKPGTKQQTDQTKQPQTPAPQEQQKAKRTLSGKAHPRTT